MCKVMILELSTMVGLLGTGYVTSLEIFALTLLGSIPLGIIVALGRLSHIKPLSFIVKLYI